MAELRNLLVTSFMVILQTIKDSTCKSATLNLNLAPEWKAEISRRASDYVEQVILPFMAKELSQLTVPEVRGNANTLLGKVKYDLQNVKLSNVVIEKSTVALLPEHGLKIRTDHVSGSMTSKWHYKQNSWPHISDSGTCDLSIGDLSLGLSFFLDGDLENENAKVKAKDCQIKIGSLHVKFKGGASWLYNIFADGLASRFKDKLTKQICDAAIDLINSKATEKLDTFVTMMKKFAA
ncbi:BPI fold-containing family C protein-like [Acropora millepora]|uniref:BPI fold-containing family C protein-like n=1 Tax=Acropora millepora TaxID=45264 RepID=UPI0010FCA043|nr:BPI fold-containing family C protein-like [Acropora millepora]